MLYNIEKFTLYPPCLNEMFKVPEENLVKYVQSHNNQTITRNNNDNKIFIADNEQDKDDDTTYPTVLYRIAIPIKAIQTSIDTMVTVKDISEWIDLSNDFELIYMEDDYNDISQAIHQNNIINNIPSSPRINSQDIHNNNDNSNNNNNNNDNNEIINTDSNNILRKQYYTIDSIPYQVKLLELCKSICS